MRIWRRAPVDLFCGGGCHRRLKIGDPYCAIQVLGLKRELVRCVLCAGQPAPADLPPLIVPAALTAPLVPVRGPLPLDYRRSREPGEDG